jgi:hypothetical protein
LFIRDENIDSPKKENSTGAEIKYHVKQVMIVSGTEHENIDGKDHSGESSEKSNDSTYFFLVHVFVSCGNAKLVPVKYGEDFVETMIRS